MLKAQMRAPHPPPRGTLDASVFIYSGSILESPGELKKENWSALVPLPHVRISSSWVGCRHFIKAP